MSLHGMIMDDIVIIVSITVNRNRKLGKELIADDNRILFVIANIFEGNILL
jgi:hypothetical protein